MTTLVSSYGIILPDSRQIVFVNAQPGERVDKILIIGSSQTQVAAIQCYEDIQSMLLNDGGPAYTTRFMELESNSELVTSLISLNGSQVVDHERCAMISSYILKYHDDQSLRANDLSEDHEHSVKIGRNMEKEEVDVCVICLKEFEMGEACVALECEHGYHQECIEIWLRQKNDCPICRAKVFPFLSRICMFRAGS